MKPRSCGTRYRNNVIRPIVVEDFEDVEDFDEFEVSLSFKNNMLLKNEILLKNDKVFQITLYHFFREKIGQFQNFFGDFVTYVEKSQDNITIFYGESYEYKQSSLIISYIDLVKHFYQNDLSILNYYVITDLRCSVLRDIEYIMSLQKQLEIQNIKMLRILDSKMSYVSTSLDGFKTFVSKNTYKKIKKSKTSNNPITLLIMEYLKIDF